MKLGLTEEDFGRKGPRGSPKRNLSPGSAEDGQATRSRHSGIRLCGSPCGPRHAPLRESD